MQSLTDDAVTIVPTHAANTVADTKLHTETSIVFFMVDFFVVTLDYVRLRRKPMRNTPLSRQMLTITNMAVLLLLFAFFDSLDASSLS